MATDVSSLCGLTSAVGAATLIRESWLRRTRWLRWSRLSFACFAVSDVLAFADLVMLQESVLPLCARAPRAWVLRSC